MGDTKTDKKSLTYNETIIVHEWMINGHNRLRAYQKVHPDANDNTAATKASVLFKKQRIQDYVEKQHQKLLNNYGVTEGRILEELAAIAFLDIRDIVDEDGSLRPISQIPEQARRAIAGIKIKATYEGPLKLEEAKIKSIILSKKDGALKTLALYKKMLTEKHEIAASDDLAAAIIGARKRTKVEIELDTDDPILKELLK